MKRSMSVLCVVSAVAIAAGCLILISCGHSHQARCLVSSCEEAPRLSQQASSDFTRCHAKGRTHSHCAWCLVSSVSRAQGLTTQTLSCKQYVMLIAISHHAGSGYTHCQVNERRPTHQARCLVSSNEQEPGLGQHAGSEYHHHHAKQCRRTIMQGMQ